jgi:hypothetical protein
MRHSRIWQKESKLDKIPATYRRQELFPLNRLAKFSACLRENINAQKIPVSTADTQNMVLTRYPQHNL